MSCLSKERRYYLTQAAIKANLFELSRWDSPESEGRYQLTTRGLQCLATNHSTPGTPATSTTPDQNE